MIDKYLFLDSDGLRTHFSGDEEMIGELVEVFAETYPAILSELKNSAAASDFELFERSAHSLKGIVANFFSPSIKNDCFVLEKMGKNKNLESANKYICNIETNIPKLLEEIKLFLNGEV